MRLTDFGGQDDTPNTKSLPGRNRRSRGRPGLGVLSYHCSIHEESAHGAGGPLLAEGRLTISVGA